MARAKGIARLAGVSLAVMTFAAGCVIEAGIGPPPNGIAVSGPPPGPMREAQTAPPDAEAFWIAGYWHWTGMQYTWIPGHWERAPHGARWHAPRYTLRDGVYFYEPGGWSTHP
jgi:hypothetical protein